MDDDAAPAEGAGPSDVGDDATPPTVRPRWSGIAGDVPAAPEGHTQPESELTGTDQANEPLPADETGEPVEPTETGETAAPTQPMVMVTPWWSSSAGPTNADGAPPRTLAPPQVRTPSRTSSSGTLRPILIAALVGALVASLVTGLLFVAFRDDNNNSSTGTTTPLAITGANARNAAPLPNGSAAMNIPAVLAARPTVGGARVDHDFRRGGRGDRHRHRPERNDRHQRTRGRGRHVDSGATARR